MTPKELARKIYLTFGRSFYVQPDDFMEQNWR